MIKPEKSEHCSTILGLSLASMIKSLATKIFFSVLLLSIVCSPPLSAQQRLSADFSYGLQSPLGRLQNRYGHGYRAGIGIKYHTGFYGLMTSIDGAFLFGDRVKEDVLQNLRTSEGFIYGNDKTAANIQLRMRGWLLGLSLGKDWRISELSNIRFATGIGYLSHKIRIQDDPQTTVPQLNAGYKKGYDRLEGGMLLYHTLDWVYQSSDEKINFSLGMEALVGKSTGLRSYQFDLREDFTQRQTTAWIAIKAAWILPFFQKDKSKTWY